MAAKKKTAPTGARRRRSTTRKATRAKAPRKTAKAAAASKKAAPRRKAQKPGDGSGNLTPKQARFAFEYIRCGNASAAYRDTYAAENMAPETVHRNAHVLLKSNKIATRVAALQAELQERHLHSLDRLLLEAEDARMLAMDLGQPRGAVDAITLKARLLGLDKPVMPAEETLANRFNVADASAEHLDALDEALKAVFPDMADAPPPSRRH